MVRRPASLLLERNRQSGRHPPLSCRTSPPQGGRSARRRPFAHIALAADYQDPILGRRFPVLGSPRLILISPLVGEMSGRTEGGNTATYLSAILP
ncbi:hypothetical protein CPT32_02425 [Rhizobium sophoriradicis]|nr:hypothetical protein CPT32_02425 [Rhizobium sophoriradicis]